VQNISCQCPFKFDMFNIDEVPGQPDKGLREKHVAYYSYPLGVYCKELIPESPFTSKPTIGECFLAFLLETSYVFCRDNKPPAID
jgi:hypothetical protein